MRFEKQRNYRNAQCAIRRLRLVARGEGEKAPPHKRMKNCFQVTSRASRFPAKDLRSELFSINPAILRQHRRAEPSDDGRYGLAARRLQLVNDIVRI